MRFALLVSVTFHFLLFGLVFIKSNPSEVRSNQVQIEMIDNQKPKVERIKKKVGAKKQTNINELKPLDTSGPSIKSFKDSPATGNAMESVSAQKSSGAKLNADVTNKYASELTKFIDRNQFYPKRALMMRQEGTVKVKIHIDRDGKFKKISILEKASHASLNKAAKDLFIRLGTFKPLPKNYRGSGVFVVPIVYDIRSKGL